MLIMFLKLMLIYSYKTLLFKLNAIFINKIFLSKLFFKIIIY